MDVYQHGISIVNRLVREGHVAYFAGGWVRDHLMGHASEDIDIASSASPIEITELFPNTILVGLTFGVVIVPHGGHQFEVASFRKDLLYEDGRRPQGVEPSTPQEDALRRDFTINGMFFDPIEHVIHDYVHGREDIEKQIIRTIGDPYERFFEDRLRMLRAFRFAARFGFAIDVETQEAIRANANDLFPAVAMERVWQEFNKMAAYPRFDQALVEMHRLSLLEVIFPEIAGMHVTELRHLVAPFAQFPSKTPAILYLMQLFPKATFEQKTDIARRLKVSNRDVKLVEFIEALRLAVEGKMEKSDPDWAAWAHFYAHPDCQLCLRVMAANMTDGTLFLTKHAERLEHLQTHIQRLQEKRPLVTAALLRKQGIQPGKHMGVLLKMAEHIAINANHQEAETVLEQLMHMPIWTTGHENNL